MKIGSAMPTLPRLRFSALVALSLCPAVGLALPASARQAVVGVTATSGPTLGDVLPQLRWNVAQSGSLLVVDPKNVSSRTALPTPPDTGYRLTTLAPVFARKVVPVGTVTVLAPTEMAVLATRPGVADPDKSLRRDEVMRRLAASLTPRQWEMLGSAEGLGAADLDGAQRSLFLTLLPDPFRAASRAGGTAVTLSESQRTQVRVRVAKAVNWTFHAPGAAGQRASMFIMPLPKLSADGKPAEEYLLQSAPDFNRPDAFGQTLRETVPSHLKPGDLDFATPALNAPVSLHGAEASGALTLGELVRRVREATGAELYADGRVAALPIWTRGETARAGDVLKAMCYAVMGTFRKVSDPDAERPAYVLTDDREGIGTRLARLQEWYEAAQQRKTVRDAELSARIREANGAQYVRFDDADPLASLPALRKKLATSRAGEGMYGAGPEVSIDELPIALQGPIREQITQLSRLSPGKPADTDKVRLETQTRVGFLVPDVGEVSAPGIRFDPSGGVSSSLARPLTIAEKGAPEKVRVPALPGRALFANSTNAEEAQEVVGAAKARGFNQVWVEVTPGMESQTTLLAAIAAGKKEGIAVWAVMRALYTRGTVEGTPDTGILGGDSAVYARSRQGVLPGAFDPIPIAPAVGKWLAPDDSATQAFVTAWATERARTPGLAGIVVRDSAAPGYSTPEGDGDLRSCAAGNDFGYTPRLRLAFLRREGYDPVDLAGGQIVGVDLGLPFFPDASPTRILRLGAGGTPPAEPVAVQALRNWNRSRYEAGAKFLASLRQALKQAMPSLPVLIASRPVPYASTNAEAWFGSWDAPNRLPYPSKGQPGGMIPQAKQAHIFSTLAVASLTPSEGTQEVDSSRQIAGLLARDWQGWDGLVLDLSGVPVAKVVRLLLDAILPPVG